MRYAVKNKGKLVRAYELGAGGEMERLLLAEGAIRREPDGGYRLFSKEAVNGVGESARAGDFFKVDTENGRHFPYPNRRAWFLERHIPLGGDEYEQRVVPVPIWTKDDPPCDAVDELLASGRLRIDPKSRTHYFNACLWGSPLSAAEDAVLVFQRLERDADGRLVGIVFNIVAREIFERDYTVCAEKGRHAADGSAP